MQLSAKTSSALGAYGPAPLAVVLGGDGASQPLKSQQSVTAFLHLGLNNVKAGNNSNKLNFSHNNDT